MPADTDTQARPVLEFKVAPERLRLGRVEIQGLPFKDGQMGLVTVDDRDGSRVTLPVVNIDKFYQLGITQVFSKETPPDAIEYFNEAIKKLPYLMAIHATFNCEPRPDLNDFPPPSNGQIIRMVGLDGPPHSGKTVFATALAVLEPDENWGIRDADPFSFESLENSIADVKAALALDPEPPGSHRIQMECQKQFRAKRLAGTKQDTSGLTLKAKLDSLLNEFRVDNRRVCYILDLPGIDDNTPFIDAFHLVATAIPIVDLLDALPKNMTRERLLNTDIADRPGYFNRLRRRILPLEIWKDDPDPKLLALAMFGHDKIQKDLQSPIR